MHIKCQSRQTKWKESEILGSSQSLLFRFPLSRGVKASDEPPARGTIEAGRRPEVFQCEDLTGRAVCPASLLELVEEEYPSSDRGF